MKRKKTLILIFTLVFSIIFNITVITNVIADISNDKPIMEWNSNIENKETNVPINKEIIIRFNSNIKRGYGNIVLYYADTFEKEYIQVHINGNKLSIKPTNRLKNSTRYILILERGSVIDNYGNYINEVSYTFTTGKESEKKDDEDPEEKDQTSGEQFGQIAGELNGYKDFLNNKSNNWSRSIPSKRKIISDYNLNKETLEYRESFLIDFEESFIKGYEKAYRNENFSIMLKSHSDGASQGQFFGNLLGEINGRKDYYNNETNNWTRWLPSDNNIISEYNLSNDNNAYLESFIHAFKDGYKGGYINSFRETNVEDNKIIKENGINHGQSIGRLAGETQGKLDYVAGKNNDWRSSLPTDEVLINTYNLTREHVEYMEGFLVGYKDGYREGYVLTFQNENLEVSIGNLNTTYISMSGGEVNSYDGGMKLKIEPGTIYTETALTIAKLNTNLPMDKHIMPATSSYNIKVQNIKNFMDLKKPIILEFEYYGSDSAGIYELRNGRWFYLHSTIKDNTISTIVNTNKYEGGTYVVLIDESYKSIDDISRHWAAKPIETFLKRNYINGYPDKTFRPDQSITRAELVKVLDNVYNWNRYSPYISTSTHFADSSIFGVFANSISKATSLGYVKGYEDNTFRPHISITYQEVEWLIQRITNNYNFKWDTVADKILKDYYVRSKSYNSKQNYITRAEVVYLLYSLEEGLL